MDAEKIRKNRIRREETMDEIKNTDRIRKGGRIQGEKKRH